jgi:hypothetical protein
MEIGMIRRAAGLLLAFVVMGAVGEETPGQGEAVSPQVRYTFIDTLNRGIEIHVGKMGEPAAVDTPRLQSGAADRFRIQVFASSQVEAAQQEKKKLESKTKLSVFMSIESPLYKLYVGDFPSREEADSQLAEIRKKGYSDAWVVRMKALAE